MPPPTVRDDEAASEEAAILAFRAEAEVAGESQPAAPTVHFWRRPLFVGTTVMAVMAIAAIAAAYFGVGAPAPPPPAAIVTGTASFTSEPSGALVAIDGSERGVTPLTLSLPVGQHSAQVTFHDSARTLPLAIAANTTLAQHVEFASAVAVQTGRVDVASDPPGARVTLDGTSVGTAPLSLADVPSGDHTLTIASDQTRVRRSITVKPGATATVVVALAPTGATGGWLQITAPIPLDVFEHDQLIGTTEANRLMLPAGRHDLEVANQSLGFRTPLRAEIVPGATATAAVPVPNGSISVNALPWANVAIDGHPVGTTPLANIEVPIGRHTIVWQHPELGERTQSVVLTTLAPLRIGMDFSK